MTFAVAKGVKEAGTSGGVFMFIADVIIGVFVAVAVLLVFWLRRQ